MGTVKWTKIADKYEVGVIENCAGFYVAIPKETGGADMIYILGGNVNHVFLEDWKSEIKPQGGNDG